jgi:uncharacterized membrane protein
MPPLYKEGLYWLILLAVTTFVYAILAFLIGPVLASGAFFLFGIAGFLPLVYRKKGKTVLLDERDTLIAHRALIAGYSIFWLVFTLGVMGLWTYFYSRGQEMISVHVLPNIVCGGTIVFATFRAVAILVQYHWQDADKGE